MREPIQLGAKLATLSAGRRDDADGDLGALRSEVLRLRHEVRAAEDRIAELVEAVRVRDEFLGVAGHELRNPMGAIVVSVTNMRYLAEREADAPAWLAERLRRLDRLARNFVRRAATLLDVSRLAAGKLTLDRDIVSLADVVNDVVLEIGAEASAAGCELRTRLADGVTGWWDRTAIEQVALNLVSNAVKYGAGHPVLVESWGDEDTASLVVTDEGPGISDEDRARVFERFERAVPRKNRPGFGLGLWISRQIVTAHGGEILLESRPGDGSVFTVRLPRGNHERPE